MDIPSPTASTELAPDITTHSLIRDKRKRNIVIGSVLGGLVLVCVLIVIIYMLVFRPRVYYGNHVMITTIQQPMSADPNKKNSFIPSGPFARYTLTPSSGGNNAVAELIMNNQTSCMLVSLKLERKGLVHEGDTCLIWEPLSNTYLFANECDEYLDNKTACTNAAMGNNANQCVWSTGKGVCTGKSNMAPMVFRTLPKKFSDLVKDLDPTGSNAFVNGFLFHFSGVEKANNCASTCTPNPSNMLRTHTNYALVSNQNKSFIVGSLNSGVHWDNTNPYTSSFNWQFMK